MSKYKLVPVGRVKTVGGYPDESEHAVEWLCKYKDLKDGDLLYATPQPTGQGEPVAYLFHDEIGRTKIALGKETAEYWAPPGEPITPLYAAPQSSEAGEAMTTIKPEV